MCYELLINLPKTVRDILEKLADPQSHHIDLRINQDCLPFDRISERFRLLVALDEKSGTDHLCNRVLVLQFYTYQLLTPIFSRRLGHHDVIVI